MIFKIHYTINGFEDEVILEGETVADIQKEVKRVIPANATDMWSEEIK